MTRVLILVNDFTSTSIPVEIAAEVDRRTNVQILLASFYDSSESTIDPDVRELDIPMYQLAASSRVDYSAYSKLRQICISEDIDILHTHHNSTGSLAKLSTIGTNTKIVNTEHNDHYYFSNLQVAVNAATYPFIDVMVSNSKSTKNSLGWYENLLLNGCPHKVVYNGIDQDRIDSAEPSDIPLSNGPTVVSVGRLVEQKNYPTLLHSFKSVLKHAPNTNLVIVGDGPLSADLKQLASELSIRESVIFTGYLPRREHVYGVLKKSDVAVVSSWYEGFCVAAVEAMAAGLPIVASDIDVLHEVVGEPGVFADPHDKTDFADKIAHLIKNKPKRKELGVQAKKRARTEFSLERTAQEHCNIYKSLADNS